MSIQSNADPKTASKDEEQFKNKTSNEENLEKLKLLREACSDWILICSILAGFSASFIVMIISFGHYSGKDSQVVLSFFLFCAFSYVFAATGFLNVAKNRGKEMNQLLRHFNKIVKFAVTVHILLLIGFVILMYSLKLSIVGTIGALLMIPAAIVVIVNLTKYLKPMFAAFDNTFEIPNK